MPQNFCLKCAILNSQGDWWSVKNVSRGRRGQGYVPFNWLAEENSVQAQPWVNNNFLNLCTPSERPCLKIFNNKILQDMLGIKVMRRYSYSKKEKSLGTKQGLKRRHGWKEMTQIKLNLFGMIGFLIVESTICTRTALHARLFFQTWIFGSAEAYPGMHVYFSQPENHVCTFIQVCSL